MSLSHFSNNFDNLLIYIRTRLSLDKENALPYENKLPVFDQMLKKHPNNARFMKLVADAPTTTLQRLKGITTGSLPTFIDIGSNFATSEINEDNFIDQVFTILTILENDIIEFLNANVASLFADKSKQHVDRVSRR